jgi:hypothetical protein
MSDPASSYPVTLAIDYPDRALNRASTFFRGILIIPAAVMVALVAGPDAGWGKDAWRFFYVSGATLFVPLVLMLLFRRKYPRWWFDWNLAFTRFSSRVGAYAALLTDEYPSTEREQTVHIEIPYPDAKKDLLPGLPLVKWFLAIPHWFLLFFLGIAAGFCIFISWFAILFTGRFPRPLFDFVVGVGRWGFRAGAYAFLLVTDAYPPFSLK